MATWRLIVTAPDGAGHESLITTEVPISSADITVSLSAPGSLKLTVPFYVAQLKRPDGLPVFQPWGTCVYAERDGVIVSGGIVTDTEAAGTQLSVTAVGFLGYWKGMPYMDDYKVYEADPLDVARLILAHVQGQKGGNIGLAASPLKSRATVGVRGRAAFRGRPDIKDANGNVVLPAIAPSPEVKDEPYLLSWYQTTDLLDEFNKLAKATPFDYAERHFWSGGQIAHVVDFGYPVIGTRRPNLRFILGENLIEAPKTYQAGDSYASTILGLGSGEGSKKLRVEQTVPGATRLRRVDIYNNQSIGRTPTMQAILVKRANNLTGLPTAGDFSVIDSPNAPIGSFQVGDTVFVQGDDSWYGDAADKWARIVSMTYKPGTEDEVSITVVKEENELA